MSLSGENVQLIPVIDIRDGVVVRAVAGERQQYRPVQSVLTSSIQPHEVAQAIADQFGFRCLYVADLDGILDGRPNLPSLKRLAETGLELMADVGVRSALDVSQLPDCGVHTIVVALESLPDEDTAAELAVEFGTDQLILSLDLRRGRPVTQVSRWRDRSPTDLVRRFVADGFHRFIVLDVADVGTGSGVTTLPLCRALKSEFSGIRVITGGGIQSAADLKECVTAGVDGLLIASALHSGRITPADAAAFSSGVRSDERTVTDG